MASSRPLRKHLANLPVLLNGREDCGAEVRRSLFGSLCTLSHSLYSKNLSAHFGCVNAVEFSRDGSLLITGGDDRRVLLWRVGKCLSDVDTIDVPVTMRAEHNSNIFCLEITNDNGRILSGGNDEQVILHDSRTLEPLDYFLHEQPVYSVCLNPECNFTFATAGDDGRVLIFDTREPYSTNSTSMSLAVSEAAFHSVMFNPVDPRIVATANAKEGAALWDIRKPKTCLFQFETNRRLSSGGTSIRFDQTGSRLLCLRRRKFPVLYDVTRPWQKGTELKQDGYSNFCTMKSCSFAGENDEFAVSGSDDNHVYLWKLPEKNSAQTEVSNAFLTLKGHRSIVNQVRYNSLTCCLATSGVEKIVKLWTPLPLPGGNNEIVVNQEKPKRKFTHNDYLRLMLRSGQLLSHNFSQRSTEEDTNMLAFFDMLVRREKEEFSDYFSTDSDSDQSAAYAAGSSLSASSSTQSDSDSSVWSEPTNLVSPIRSGGRIVSYDELSPGPSGTVAEHGVSDSETLEHSRFDLPEEVAGRVNQQRKSVSFRRSSSSEDEQPGERSAALEGCDEEDAVFHRRMLRKRQYRRRRNSSDSS